MSSKLSAGAPTKAFRARDPNYADAHQIHVSRTQGFLRHVDVRIEDLAPGRCVLVADFRAELAQQNGYFHGGLIGTLADAAGACAASTLIEDRQYVLTAEYKVNFLAPAKAAQLKAVGEVARAGRTLTVSEVHLYGVDGDRRGRALRNRDRDPGDARARSAAAAKD